MFLNCVALDKTLQIDTVIVFDVTLVVDKQTSPNTV
jgi:hypothetical protein